MRRLRLCLSGLALLAMTTGAARADDAELEGPAAQSAASCPRDLAQAYARRDTLVSAAAGDSRLVFVTQPLTASVAVLALINAALQADQLQPPWIITKLYVRPPQGGDARH